MISKDLPSSSMDRRQFTTLLTAVGITAPRKMFAQAKTEKPEVLELSRNAWVPNNERLPVLIYHGAFEISGPDPAIDFEMSFQSNGWPPQWRNGIYDFHH